MPALVMDATTTEGSGEFVGDPGSKGQPLALVQRHTPPRRHAPSGLIHPIWPKNGASTTSCMYQIGLSGDPDERG